MAFCAVCIILTVAEVAVAFQDSGMACAVPACVGFGHGITLVSCRVPVVDLISGMTDSTVRSARISGLVMI